MSGKGLHNGGGDFSRPPIFTSPTVEDQWHTEQREVWVRFRQGLAAERAAVQKFTQDATRQAYEDGTVDNWLDEQKVGPAATGDVVYPENQSPASGPNVHPAPIAGFVELS